MGHVAVSCFVFAMHEVHCQPALGDSSSRPCKVGYNIYIERECVCVYVVSARNAILPNQAFSFFLFRCLYVIVFSSLLSSRYYLFPSSYRPQRPTPLQVGREEPYQPIYKGQGQSAKISAYTSTRALMEDACAWCVSKHRLLLIGGGREDNGEMECVYV